MNRLERRANVIRSRLLRTIDALDVRRHQVTETVHEAKALAPRIGITVLGVVAVTAGAVAGIRAWVKGRRERLLAYRVRHFFAELRAPRQPAFGVQLVQRVTLTIVTMAATELTRRTLKNTLDGRLPDGRLAVGTALESHHRALSR